MGKQWMMENLHKKHLRYLPDGSRVSRNGKSSSGGATLKSVLLFAVLAELFIIITACAGV